MTSFALLIKEISQHLLQKKQLLVTAESCTGGLIASCITEQAGSSQWFERGFVTYSNLSKQQMLSVPDDLITNDGAVSEPVAAAMAIGALLNSIGHVALSVTGIAGPDGGSAEKPVGTVCFAWVMRGLAPRTMRVQLSGNRREIRLMACKLALDGVLTLLQG